MTPGRSGLLLQFSIPSNTRRQASYVLHPGHIVAIYHHC